MLSTPSGKRISVGWRYGKDLKTIRLYLNAWEGSLVCNTRWLHFLSAWFVFIMNDCFGRRLLKFMKRRLCDWNCTFHAAENII